MAQGLLQRIMVPLYEERKENRYWIDGRLQKEEKIRSAVNEIRTVNGLDETGVQLENVFLFGSLLELRDKEGYRRDPSDVDLWCTIKEKPSIDLETVIKSDYEKQIELKKAICKEKSEKISILRDSLKKSLPSIEGLPYHINFTDETLSATDIGRVRQVYQIYPRTENPLLQY